MDIAHHFFAMLIAYLHFRFYFLLLLRRRELLFGRIVCRQIYVRMEGAKCCDAQPISYSIARSAMVCKFWREGGRKQFDLLKDFFSFFEMILIRNTKTTGSVGGVILHPYHCTQQLKLRITLMHLSSTLLSLDRRTFSCSILLHPHHIIYNNVILSTQHRPLV